MCSECGAIWASEKPFAKIARSADIEELVEKYPHRKNVYYPINTKIVSSSPPILIGDSDVHN